MSARLPPLLRNRDFNLYWAGVALSQIGVRGTTAVNLFHVYDLTGSTALVGIVGLVQGIAVVTLSPLGGTFADRVDRRRLLQATQIVSLFASLALAGLSLGGTIAAWHIYVAVLVNTASSTFDHPTRTALIPALVPRAQLPQAFALVNPTRELAILAGPALGGLLLAVSGPAAMYLFDAMTYVVLIVVLSLLRVPRLDVSAARAMPVLRSMREGASYLRRRSLIWQLLSLDLSTTLLAGWRVILPALAVDILGAGEIAYGLLAAAPSAGALIGTAAILPLLTRAPAGPLVLLGTAAYGLACIALAQSPTLSMALVAGLGIGAMDALASAIRHAAVQLETPDAMRGRVTSLVQVASRGGPALGDANVGWMAALLGPAAALTLGGIVPIVYAAGVAVFGAQVRSYRVLETSTEPGRST
ncbi:MFS transporter [Egicoccus sp. AB-alg6-2]|uniref:MFS transporter n=1 Tax=Egicoccus sp. AB-alg6-2 TaxID=3242692 RepID=UPI00359D5DE2